MKTITEIARQIGISRTTVLYYENQGLLKPASRSNNGYRWYGEREHQRLKTIVMYRSYGLSVAHIRKLLDINEGASQFQILRNHLNVLGDEIQKLKKQQKAIINLLQEPKLLEKNNVTKTRWIEIMEAAGYDENAMIEWHQKFEEMEPDEHQFFLESLGIEAEEILKIRNF